MEWTKMAFVDKPLFYNVPILAGVPSMVRAAGYTNPYLSTIMGAVQSAIFSYFSYNPFWGVLDSNGNPVMSADTVLNVDYRNDQRVSNFPVQEGSFASYDKINNPYSCRVSMAKGGKESERAKFIDDVDFVAKSLDLFTIVTPEKVYRNANVEGYDYSRTVDDGAYMYTVELRFTEIRQVTATYTTTETKTENAKQETAKSEVDLGKAEAKPVPTKQGGSMLDDLKRATVAGAKELYQSIVNLGK